MILVTFQEYRYILPPALILQFLKIFYCGSLTLIISKAVGQTCIYGSTSIQERLFRDIIFHINLKSKKYFFKNNIVHVTMLKIIINTYRVLIFNLFKKQKISLIPKVTTKSNTVLTTSWFKRCAKKRAAVIQIVLSFRRNPLLYCIINLFKISSPISGNWKI